jgi:hypothetical protein
MGSDDPQAGGSSAQPAMISASPETAGRPVAVTDLLFEGEISPSWFIANKRMNRFFLLNLEPVLEDLNLDHTLAGPYFKDAAIVIASQTAWHTQYPFEYKSSHTQIFPDKRRKSKNFGHAVTIIVAMEKAAAVLKPGYNVYDKLRILAASYFVDSFDERRLGDLKKYYNALSAEDRIATFGVGADKKSFDQVLLEAIEQLPRRSVHEQLAKGHCGSKYVCEKLEAFINTKFPSDLNVGPVLQSGAEDATNSALGRKNAAPDLRVPRIRSISS